MSMFLDIKYAIRQLFKTPKFTALTLFVLIGGLSISLFTFSFLYSLIYKPLPLPGGESIFRLSISINGEGRSIPAYELLQVRQDLKTVEHLEIFETIDMRISNQDIGKTFPGTYVENEVFRFTQTEPVLGRVFNADDMLPSAPPTVILSHIVWQQDYNQDPNIIGKSIRINDRLTTIIGVMPKAYNFPINARLWLPLPERLRSLTPDSQEYIQAYGRVKKGFSNEQAELEIGQAMDAIYQQTAKQFQKPEGKLAATLYTFPHAQTDGDGNLVFTFFNLIAFSILLLACINVGNLLLARAIERSKETAIRAALGAPTNRLVLQLMWEGIIITLLGSLLAVLLVSDLLDYTDALLHAEVSENLPFWWHWGMDIPTLLMALGFTLVTIVLASFIPAWRSAKQDINATLRDGTRGAQGKKAGKMSRILVTVQIFLISTLMLIGSISAFLSQYLLNMDSIEDYTRVIHGGIFLSDKDYQTPQQKIRFFEDFYDRIKRKDNVEDAVVRGYFGTSELILDGEDQSAENQFPKIDTMSLIGNTEFFSAKLVEGRHLDKRDNADAPKSILISDSMKTRYWPNESVLNKRISIRLNDEIHLVHIVGVVKDRLNESSIFRSQDSEDEIYLSGLQFERSFQRVFYRYSGEINTAEESFYQVLFTLDRTIEPYRVEPASRNFDMMRKAMIMTSYITFGAGGFALLLALTGIYGLTSNMIAQRTHEIGIRRAVGATNKEIVQMLLKQGSKQLAIGLSLGLFTFALISFAFHSFTDGNLPIALYFVLAGVVTIGLLVVVLAAIYSPARRAVAMEPNAALRYE